MAKILVADDNTELRLLICESLRMSGHEVAEASNGIVALAEHSRTGARSAYFRYRHAGYGWIGADIKGPSQEFPTTKIIAITGDGITDSDL